MLVPTTMRVFPFALAVVLIGCDAQSQKAKAGKADDASTKSGEADDEGKPVKSAESSQVVVDENGNIQIRQANGSSVDISGK